MRLAEPGASAADRSEFEAWRAQGPEFELSFERERRVWERAHALKTADLGGDRRLMRLLNRRVAVAEAGSPSLRFVLWVVLAAVVFILVSGIVVGAWILQWEDTHVPPATMSRK